MSGITEWALGDVRALLQQHRYSFRDEVQLHEAIAGVLRHATIEFEREKVITPKSRLDFYLPIPRIGIEVKTNGAMQPAMRQVGRYLEHPDVDAMLLVATRAWARRSSPPGPFSFKSKKLFTMGYLARPM